MTTVTQGDWSVGCMTGSSISGAVLHVNRHIKTPTGRYVIKPGDHDGKSFPTSDAAYAFALDKGYTQQHFRRVWCRKCRAEHSWCAKHSEFVR